MKVHECDGKWFDDSGIPLPPLTLPLRAGQRVICRDGVEREVVRTSGNTGNGTFQARMNGENPNYIWADTGKYYLTDPMKHDLWDAIADAPVRTADAKPDEKKPLNLEVGKAYKTRGGWKAVVYGTQPNERYPYVVRHYDLSIGYNTHQRNGLRFSEDNLSNSDLISEWPGEKKEQAATTLHAKACIKHHWAIEADPKSNTVFECPACATAKEKEQAAAAEKYNDGYCSATNHPPCGNCEPSTKQLEADKPAVQPAILPTWTDGDCCAFCARFTIAHPEVTIPILLKPRAAAEWCLDWKPTPKPDTRPDIPQPDCSSDSFVARKHWRMTNG